MSKYENELAKLKPRDEVQHTVTDTESGYQFIHTAGHGYLVVPREDKHHSTAMRICEYGFIGDHAIYLEEDCEYREFINEIKSSKICTQ